MGMNIKNADTHRLVRELAELTGENQTEAITRAVKERLERLRRQKADDFVERLLSIGRECASHLKEPYKSIDHGDLLYDENGLPK